MYTANYDFAGKICGIKKDTGESIPICLENRHYQEFLEWNSKQETPLILSDKAPDPPTIKEVQRQNNLDLIQTLKNKQDEWTVKDLEDAVKALINLQY